MFDTGNNIYSDCNCFNDIIDNFYVNFVLKLYTVIWHLSFWHILLHQLWSVPHPWFYLCMDIWKIKKWMNEWILKIYTQYFESTPYLCNVCYKSQQSQPLWFNQPNKVGWRAYILKPFFPILLVSFLIQVKIKAITNQM